MTWGTDVHGFAAQRPLADAAELLVVDRRGFGGSPEEWLRASTEAAGMAPLEPTPARLRAAATAMRERPCWEADVPLAALAAAPLPKLVICGTWGTAPAAYRAAAGEALMACAAVV